MSWPLIALEEIANVNWGNTSITKKSYSESGYRAYSASGNDGFLPNYEIEGNGIVLSAIGARCGRCFLASGKWTAIKNTITIQVGEQACLDYLYRFINNGDIWLKKGGGQPFISLGDARKTLIPLPPLEEQKRIAAILDKADAVRRKRQQAIELADKFLQSVFLDMFGDPVTNPKGWKTIQLGKCLSFLTSGSRGWAKYYSKSGSKFIRIQNVGKNKILIDDLAYVNAPAGAEAERTKVQLGDVLLSITADLGRSAVVTEEICGAHINQHLALLRLNGLELTPRFLAAYLSSAGGDRQFQVKNKSAVKSGLNFDDIRTVEVPCPPKDMQIKYEHLYEKNLRSVSIQKVASNYENSLFASLSQQAFKGELTKEEAA